MKVKGLGRKTTAGAMWMIGGTGVVKGSGLIAHLILAYLLLESEFGLYAMAVTVASVAALVEWVGTGTVLTRRGGRVHLWMLPGLILSLSIGLFAMLAIWALAPLAAWAYGEPAVIGLAMVLSLKAVFSAAYIPAGAYLRAHMRFKAAAGLQSLQALSGAAICISLAFMDFGAYSFAIGISASLALEALAGWLIARPRIRWRTRGWQRARYLYAGSAKLTIANLFQQVSTRGDYIVLGLFHSASTLGLYFMAFKLTNTIMQSFKRVLSNVLLPTLSRLRNEPARQRVAASQASEVILSLSIGLGFLQLAVAEPLFAIVLEPRWGGAVPYFQILIAAAALVNPVAPALIKSNGQFNEMMGISLVGCFLFFLITVPLAILTTPIAVALAMGAWILGNNLAVSYIALRPLDGGWGTILAIYRRPILLASVTIGPAYLAGWGASLLIETRPMLVQLFVTVVAALVLYPALTRWLSPRTWTRCLQLITGAQGKSLTHQH